MEKRSHERIPHNLKAVITSGDQTYNGMIENVSEDGLEYLITSYLQTSEGFSPQKTIDLKFEGPKGELFNLTCEVKWYLDMQDKNSNVIMGMQILNPSPEYKKLVKNLS